MRTQSRRTPADRLLKPALPLVFHYSHGFDCELVVKRVKKNYVGDNAGGCGSEGEELRFNG
jgi:hypothetical protein